MYLYVSIAPVGVYSVLPVLYIYKKQSNHMYSTIFEIGYILNTVIYFCFLTKATRVILHSIKHVYSIHVNVIYQCINEGKWLYLLHGVL